MSFLDSILGAGGGGAVSQIARQLGLPEDVARQAAGALSPALARGLQRNAAQPGGLDSLLGALKTGQHQRYVDQPEKLADETSITDGNAILGHILGSKDVSRNVAGDAAQKTGVDPAVLKKMLPMLGALAMGTLAKQTNGGNQLGSLGGTGTGADPIAVLSTFLDSDKDGDMTDDVINLAKKFF